MTPNAYRFRAPPRQFRFPATRGEELVGWFVKAPAERCPIEIDLRGLVPEGVAVSLVRVSAVDLADQSVQTSTVLASTTGRISGTIAAATVQEGTLGHRYAILFDIRAGTSRWLQRYGLIIQAVRPVATFSKQATEQFPVEIDLRLAVPHGAVLTPPRLFATDMALVEGNDQTTTVLTAAVGQVNGWIAAETVRAGTAGRRYRTDFRIRDTANHLFVESLIMRVR